MTPTSRRTAWGIIAAAGMCGWLFALATGDLARVWRALLVNFTFFTSLAAGMVCWSAIMTAARATWTGKMEKIPLSGYGFALPSIVALVLLAVGGPHWAPWWQEKFLQGFWLNPFFLMGRNLAGLLLFWWCARRHLASRHGEDGVRDAGILIFVFCIVFSLIGFDLVMALDPHWYSTLFGAYFFISALFIGAAGWALLAVLDPESAPNQLQDVGNLVMAFSILTTAMLFAQLLTIWYENMPEETRYLVPRMNFRPWSGVSLALLALVYLGPLVMLLTVWSKRTRWFLGLVAFIILCAMWVERLWLIVPGFLQSLRPGLPELSLLAGFVGICGIAFGETAERIGELPPTEEP
jgi:hypothetical protein